MPFKNFRLNRIQNGCLSATIYFHIVDTVKPVHTGMPWGQTFIPVWTGSGLERVVAFGRSTNDRWVYENKLI